MLTAVAEKTKEINPYHQHGGLLVDEMKLSENLAVNKKGLVDGFVGLGAYSKAEHEGVACDHGLVVMFQPLTGKWQQILGVFGARGNVKANVLSKIIVDAMTCAEKSGLFVDFVTCDGASWNHSMMNIFGISGKLSKTVCKIKHPVDPSRELHFISDFPHLVKCVRNAIASNGILTPDGRAGRQFVRKAWKCDTASTVMLRAMPHVTKSVFQPNGFKKMRVNLTFRFFSDEVLRNLYIYKHDVETLYGPGSTKPTTSVAVLMRDLIDAMTSRYFRKGLRPDYTQVCHIKKFLAFLDHWEATAKEGFLSEVTAEGLRVTLQSTLSLLEYVTKTLGFKYLMTSRLCQDALENLFGILRQMSGNNDHPTPTQFLIPVNCLSFYSLARSPSGGNIAQGVLNSLLDPPTSIDATDKQNKLDELLDVGHLNEAHEMVKACDAFPDHREMVEASSDSRIMYYVSGYVARKMLKKTKCSGCSRLLLQARDSDLPEEACREFQLIYEILALVCLCYPNFFCLLPEVLIFATIMLQLKKYQYF